MIYHPVKSEIHCYHLLTGELVNVLEGHLGTLKIIISEGLIVSIEPVRACIFHTGREELFSSGADRNILVWSPVLDEEDNVNPFVLLILICSSKRKEDVVDGDNWSEDDEAPAQIRDPGRHMLIPI